MDGPVQANPPFQVLVVEDDPDSALAIKRTLEGLRLPCRATVVPNVHLAVAELSRTPIDALLVDYRLPDGDGLKFIAQAQRMEPGLPTILMTGFATGELAQRATCDFHVDGILQKPFDDSRLEHVLGFALARSLRGKGGPDTAVAGPVGQVQ